MQLLITSGPAASRTIAVVTPSVLRVGRGAECEVRLDDPTASRCHAELRCDEGRVWVKDAGSRFGTFVNGVKTAECELRPGDVVLIGETTLMLEDGTREIRTTIAPGADRGMGTPARPGFVGDDDENKKTPHPSSPLKNVGWASCPSDFPQKNDGLEGHPTVFQRAASPLPAGPGRGDKVEEKAKTPHPNPLPARPGRGDKARNQDKADGQECPSYGEPRRLVGRRFGRFDVASLVAETESGAMLRAMDDDLRVEVALKVFRPEAMKDSAAVARFRRAAATMLPLTHPHLVELFDVGEEERLCWSASEWVEGENAAQMIRRIGVAGMLDWRQSLKVMLHVARALDFAARHQIVHRNLAPRRILVRKSDGVVKLGGLGLAKSLDDDTSAKVTRAGEIVGELSYCSPEQVGGKRLDARSDLYNLGATVYALLTGRPPCEGRSFHETLDKIQTQRPEPPTKFHLAVPAQLEGIVMRLLEKRPEDRFGNAGQLLADLDRAATYLGETALLDG